MNAISVTATVMIAVGIDNSVKQLTPGNNQEHAMMLKELSFAVYQSKGNLPKKLSDYLPGYLPEQYSDLTKEIHPFIEADNFFLKYADKPEYYVKSYRIREVCERTLKVLRNECHPTILKILEGNPYCLFEEFERWVKTDHGTMISGIIDEFWHQFLTFSYEYQSWCHDNYGRYIHHVPTPSYERNQVTSKDLLENNQAFFYSYSKLFEITETILLYSLPARLMFSEGKSKKEVIEIIKVLALNEPKPQAIQLKSVEQFATYVEEGLQRHGYCHIEQRLSFEQYVAINEYLGNVKSISDIKLNNESKLKFNKPESLSPHTDSPLVDTVAWYCIRQDPQVGSSVLIDCKPLIEALTESTREILRKTHIGFPLYKRFKTDSYPILRLGTTSDEIYYTRWLLLDNYSEKQIGALQALESSISNAEQVVLRLKPGEALFVDNKRMLHGRDDIPQGSPRYLYRIHTTKVPK
ncbi:TauD/TfdA family dioxygenase [Kluyvera sichuanensis]